ncbi:MAG TPA: RIP metalloprotease RseP [Candidatus Eisenbacteria bacterium]|nr:RIP metalloprotease RseP [Candidatus Eisenbacteria bacterium]
MPSALIFLFVLSVLVVVHEFGHFIVARMVGIRVEKFSIGFGPVLFGRKFGETDFVFSLLPLGGFVKMAGETPEEAKGHPWEFGSKSLVQKFAVVFAGPFMNALLAFVIFSGIYLVGQPTFTSRIGKVLDGTPAKLAGVREGDLVTAVNGVPVSTWEALLKEVRREADHVVFTIDRAGAGLDLSISPKIQETPALFGKKTRVAFVGVAPSSDMTYVKSGPVEAVRLGAKRVWDMTGMIFTSLALMITGTLPFKESVTGPIGIFFMTQEAAKLGAIYLFLFMGSLSVSLFVLNLLPIPVLDGGHVLFILIEKLKGSPLKESVKDRMTQGGMVMLLALMVFVIFQDMHRFSILDNVKHFFVK